MGERDWYQRYSTARKYADEQAEKLRCGEEVRGWTYEKDWKQGEPEPAKITLIGAAWVAHAYEIAVSAAFSLVHAEGGKWRPVYEESKRLAAHYRENYETPTPA